MTRRTRLQMAALITAVLLMTATLAPPAAAESDDCEDALVDTLCEAGVDLSALADGLVAGIGDTFGQPDDETAASAAAAFQTTVNDNNETIEAWVNNRTAASTDRDVVALTFELDDSRETVYVVAEVNETSDDYVDGYVAESTTRTVDESCTFSDNAAWRADDEAQRFVDQFAAPGNDLTETYISRLSGRYTSNVDCSFAIGG